ncbi:hypothetical protein [Nocardia alni]|uniref:hypothetical protein n=1 Tax=Nocardia alni TaxID=2815723 RepID=UPI0027DEFF16|nr:hypothetical protein [Nocardia alni]
MSSGRYEGFDDEYGDSNPGVGSGVVGEGMFEYRDGESADGGPVVVAGEVIGATGKTDPGAGGSADGGDSGAPEQVFTEWTAASRTGSITVRTSDQGLPLGISVDPAELRRDPRALAAEVLRLCKQAANRAALARRAEFEEIGVDQDALRLMGLPTPEQVAQSEIREEDEDEYEPESWLRSV